MENKTKEDRKKQFMIGLTKLTRETGILIGGCGCCGSPYLDTVEKDPNVNHAGYGYGFMGSITWISMLDEWDWEHYSKTIIR